MEIKNNEHYINSTWRFLMPCLKGHGSLFVIKFNSLFKLSVGIYDDLLENSNISKGKNIYVLCNKLINPDNFIDFITWIKLQDYYVTDYCFDAEIIDSEKHMVVIKIPKEYNNAYDQFIKGNYSLMYSDKDLKKLFSNNNRKKELNILTKDITIFEDFTEKVNKEFDTKIKFDYNDMLELELPLKKSEEIFNYNNVNQNIFFNQEIDKKL